MCILLISCAYIKDDPPIRRLSDEEMARIPAIEEAVKEQNRAELKAIAEAQERAMAARERHNMGLAVAAGIAIVGLGKLIHAVNEQHEEAYSNSDAATEPAHECKNTRNQGYRVIKELSGGNIGGTEYGRGVQVRCYNEEHPNGHVTRDLRPRLKDGLWAEAGMSDSYKAETLDKSAQLACCPFFG